MIGHKDLSQPESTVTYVSHCENEQQYAHPYYTNLEKQLDMFLVRVNIGSHGKHKAIIGYT